MREGRRRMSGAWRVWSGVTQRGAGQIQPGTDSSSSSSSVPGPSSHRHAALESSCRYNGRPLPLWSFNLKAQGSGFFLRGGGCVNYYKFQIIGWQRQHKNPKRIKCFTYLETGSQTTISLRYGEGIFHKLALLPIHFGHANIICKCFR